MEAAFLDLSLLFHTRTPQFLASLFEDWGAQKRVWISINVTAALSGGRKFHPAPLHQLLAVESG